jgi:hypothetical protein
VNSFMNSKVTGFSENLPTHYIHRGFLHCEFFREYAGYWNECRLSHIGYIHRVSL